MSRGSRTEKEHSPSLDAGPHPSKRQSAAKNVLKWIGLGCGGLLALFTAIVVVVMLTDTTSDKSELEILGDRHVSVEPLWQYRFSARVESGPTVAESAVFLGAGDHCIYALDVATGDLIWRYQTQGPVIHSPVFAGGVVYSGSNDGHLYALDTATGDLLWRYGTQGAIYSSPATSDGTVFVGSADHSLYALDAATGDLRWRYLTQGSVYSPAVENATVFAQSQDGHLYALDVDTGELRWQFHRQEFERFESRVVVADGIVYVGPFDLYALDAASGALLWRYSEGNGEGFGLMRVADGVVYVGTKYIGPDAWVSQSSRLYALDARTGDLLWRYDAGRDADSLPAVEDGVVYVSVGVRLYAVDAITGRHLWRYNPDGSSLLAPAVADGVAYVAGSSSEYADGQRTFQTVLYALSTQP